VEPVAAFHLHGTLNSDPAHQASDRAKAKFPEIFDLAVCARAAQEPLRGQCLAKASSALTKWAQTYHASGNPVDEDFFVPLFQAIDLIAPQIKPDASRELIAWVHTFAVKGDQSYAAKSSNDTVRFNNWMAARLLIRAMAATICSDKQMQESTRTMLGAFLKDNFVHSPDGKQEGETYDFIQRDALDYHIGDLLSLVQIVLYTPTVADEQTRKLIALGLSFIKPYYLGEKRHIEFVHSTVQFDVQRRLEDKNNPAFQNKPWDPTGARLLLRLARPAFPDIQVWTANVVDERYDPSVKLLAAVYGDPTPTKHDP
jgi:hypothetical protein